MPFVVRRRDNTAMEVEVGDLFQIADMFIVILGLMPKDNVACLLLIKGQSIKIDFDRWHFPSCEKIASTEETE
jgi:hypothetical protein